MNNGYMNQTGTPLYSGGMMTPNQATAPNNYSQQIPYIENILESAIKIKAKIYATFPGSEAWRDRVFDGVIEGAGRDHVVISDPVTGEFHLIPSIYVDYVSFEENILAIIQQLMQKYR